MSDESQNFEFHDVLTAFSMLSRFPVPVDHDRAKDRIAAATWAFPIVGLVIGIIAGVFGALLGWMGLPLGMVAAFVLLLMALTTGGMHEDGLADFADGVWGGSTVARRLEIMKDSRIGAYGAIALILVLLARWSGLVVFQSWELILTLAAVAAASRAMMVAVMFVVEPAKPDGLSAEAGMPSAEHTGVALAIGFAACVIFTGLSGLILFAAMAIAVIPVAYVAIKKLNGHTGDVLGACQICAETFGLGVAFALF